ncbi:MlaD family protein, partial [Arthrospira platensis SPKY1]|nr:MlaD family protein [Arthrospira platensis SPKY1]
MNQSLQTARVGLFFVLGLALIYVVYSVIGDNRLRARDGFTVDAIFDNISTLTSGADVRVAGVRVGEVQSTGLANGKAQVTILLHSGVTIPADSVASVAIGSLLGQNHVSISFGSSDRMLAAGDTLRTRPTRDFNAVFDQIGELGEKLNSLADNFTGFGDGS